MKAFPASSKYNDNWNGMDLRDYFAAKAMQGLLTTVKDEEWEIEEVAEISYRVGDAMMEARKQ